MVWYGVVGYGVVWYGMVWYGMVWLLVEWYDVVILLITIHCVQGYRGDGITCLPDICQRWDKSARL